MQNLQLSTLWARKGTIALVTVLSLVAGAAYTLVAPAVYEAEAKLLVARVQSPTALQPTANERYFLATQAEIMGSPLIVTEAMESVGMPIDRPIEDIMSDIRISPMDDTDVMSVIVRDKDPGRADKLVSAIVDSYSNYVRDVAKERSSESVQALVERERELSEELDQTQAQYVKLRSDSPLVGLDGDGIQIQMAQLQQLANELASATNLRIELDNQVKLAATTGRPPVGRGNDSAQFRLTSAPRSDQSGQYSEDAQTTQIMGDLRTARASLTDYLRRFGENHPKALATSAKVRSLESELQQHHQRITEAMGQKLVGARSMEEKLSQEYSSKLKNTKALDQFIVEEETLSNKIQRLGETQQLLITTLAQAKMAESELSNGLGAIDVRPLDGPARMSAKVWPRPSLVMGLAGILGLGLGCWIAIGLAYRESLEEEKFALNAS